MRLQVFPTLSLSSLNRKAALRRKFSCLVLQQSVAIAHDIVQVILIKRVMLQFQEALSIHRMEFWCELTIAKAIWENVNLFFGEKCTLTSRGSRFRRRIDV